MTDKLPSYYDCLLKKHPEVTPEEWLLLNRIAVVKRIKKGESFLRYGKIARYSAFVLSGLFKYCILDEEGTEKIVKFSFATDFLANCESHYKKAPSAVSIIALEDAIVLKINLKRLEDLYASHPTLLRISLTLFRELTEQQSEHQYILSLKSPLQRYRFLMERSPAIIRRISLTNIARYLYISREALSRARLYLLNRGRNFCD